MHTTCLASQHLHTTQLPPATLAYARPLMRQTKFKTHAKQGQLQVCISRCVRRQTAWLQRAYNLISFLIRK